MNPRGSRRLDELMLLPRRQLNRVANLTRSYAVWPPRRKVVDAAGDVSTDQPLRSPEHGSTNRQPTNTRCPGSISLACFKGSGPLRRSQSQAAGLTLASG